eukprot:TRINITY_DN1165_c8_g1_i1.p1 TRINITY_DN1165_c8_g1~~TRINITY_DN1165_c8_g1_i1.p1  ORF type:complete len:408 (+),score=51.13 TRINITY_DN1165_c8_g1_i1:64-1224(+)
MRSAALILFSALSVSGKPSHFPEQGRLQMSMLSEPSSCPCSDASLCDPITKQFNKEVFGFTGGSGVDWETALDWSQVTTMAWSTGSDAMCTAHKHGARVIAGALGFDLKILGSNSTAREEYVANTVAMVKAKFLDGVTFDFESPLPPHSQEAATYVQIINMTTIALHREVPGSQVSVCVAWSPFNIDGRFYDILGFSDVADLLYVMMYDTRSQIFEQCIAAPNAALPLVQHGMQQYLSLGVPASKLILGLPWYGYDYPCVGAEPSDYYCKIPLVPFRGVNCSDAAGSEVPFETYMGIVNAGNTTTGGVQWATDTATPWFNYRHSDGTIHQMWIDTPRSLEGKYEVAAKLGLRGTGPFTFNMLGSSTPQQQQQAKEMWDALHVFTKN